MSLKMTGGKFVMNAGKLSCWCCCPTTAPTFEHRSRSASKSKVGWTEFPDYVSTPPKKYRTLTLGGDVSALLWLSGSTTMSVDGSIPPMVDRGAGAYYDVNCTTPCVLVTTASNRANTGTFDGSTSTLLAGIMLRGQVPGGSCSSFCANPSQLDGNAPLVTTTPNATINQLSATSAEADWPDGFGNTFTRTASFSLEDPTEDLTARTEAALPEDYPNSTPGSYRNLPSDEFTYSIREAQWRAAPPYAPESGRTFTLVYIIRFTPISGSPVDGAEQTIGFTTGDMSAWQDIPVPTENGTNTVVFVRWECDPS